MLKNLKKLNQRGDTIIEVLIAVAILSFVLSLAYATVRRNMITLRDNQERTEASKLAQGQIDALRAKWQSNQQEIIDEGGFGFCITNSIDPPVSLGGAVPSGDFNSEDLSVYGTDCSSTFFGYVIDRVENNTDYNVYNIYVRWDSIRGSKKEIVYTYRLDKD